MTKRRAISVGVFAAALAASSVAAIADGPESQPVRPPGSSGNGAGGGIWPWVQTLFALAVVAGLIVATRYVLKWLSQKQRGVIGGGEAVEVLGRTTLSAREHLYVVRFAGRTVLIGSGPGGMRTLCEAPRTDASGDISGGACTARTVQNPQTREEGGR